VRQQPLVPPQAWPGTLGSCLDASGTCTNPPAATTRAACDGVDNPATVGVNEAGVFTSTATYVENSFGDSPVDDDALCTDDQVLIGHHHWPFVTLSVDPRTRDQAGAKPEPTMACPPTATCQFTYSWALPCSKKCGALQTSPPAYKCIDANRPNAAAGTTYTEATGTCTDTQGGVVVVYEDDCAVGAGSTWEPPAGTACAVQAKPNTNTRICAATDACLYRRGRAPELARTS
jgi:hypothetical protein